MKELQMAVVSFTPRGSDLGKKIQQLLEGTWSVTCAHKPKHLQDWCREAFEENHAVVFVGAMGIAVRTIAPFLKSKTSDPAVVVVDEMAHHVISVLSGHIGGGNELTVLLAEKLGADPVITTASDVNGKLAIDVFAKKNQLTIGSMELAKETAAAIVAGKAVSFVCDGRILGSLPKELISEDIEDETEIEIRVSPWRNHQKEKNQKKILYLIPKAFVLGIGCKKGKSAREIEAAVYEELEQHGIYMESIAAVATIDIKAEEPGLLEFAKHYSLPLFYYSSKELLEVPGAYEGSEFVRSVTGVDNVCERAAVRRVMECNPQQQPQQMIIEKCKKQGITIALAKIEWSVEF